MGTLTRPINLPNVVTKYNIRNYLETGVGDGTSMNHIYNCDWVVTYGIELDRKFETLYNDKFPNANIVFGYSKDKLPDLVKEIYNKPTLFWLDAHYPGSDYNGAPYDSEKMVEKRVPLETELNIIHENRDIQNDVFVIDDLRIYKDIPDAPWELKEKGGDEFINRILGPTHRIIEIHAHQGYAVALPLTNTMSEAEIEREIIHR